MSVISRWPDRGFSDATTSAGAGLLRTPSLADLRRVVTDLLVAAPDGPAAVGVRGGVAVRQAHPDPASRAAELVQPTGTLPPGERTDARVAAATASAPDLPAGQPFRLLVGPDHVVLTARHVIGDASITNALITGLLLAADGRPLPDALVTPTSPGMTWAVARTMLRSLRPMPRCHPVDLPRAEDQVWTPSPGIVHATFEPSALRRLKAQARSLGVRRTSLLVSLVERALGTVGIAPVDDVRTVVVDCRRYLPAGRTVQGNFSAGVGLRADWSDPEAVDGVVSLSLERARPLLHLVAGSVQARFPHGPVRPVAPGAPVRVRPDYSVVGPLRGAAALPWDGLPTLLSAIRPYRPDGLGVMGVEIGQALQVTLGYDRAFLGDVIPRAVLDALADLLAA
ncbi:hypothetical protein Q6348_02180 [Isoptericola sp. b441]|uniref:Condensation domain-containing protein n=1 Tax=Actinotalea lenta TaxID=3064654 RepID=A0ABT9D736_9CELL|nr:hypothetical protein [Isoptericola sp. b441]MDO8105999.1 hypothetical protein [Isoptericola sp. b441]